MIHINKSLHWKLSGVPYQMARIGLQYGRFIKSSGFIPYINITPVVEYVTYLNADKWAYHGNSREEAEAVLALHKDNACAGIMERTFQFPDHKFKVIRTASGHPVIVGGEDNTNRCLLFAGASRGDCSIDDSTNCDILMAVKAANSCDGGIEAAAILEPGQKLVFRVSGRKSHSLVKYEWTGDKLWG